MYSIDSSSHDIVRTFAKAAMQEELSVMSTSRMPNPFPALVWPGSWVSGVVLG